MLKYFVERWYRRRQVEKIGVFPQLAAYSFDLITSTIAFDGRYEGPELDYLAKNIFPKLRSRRVCLDIGANIGNHSIFFADHFESVWAFEPHPRTYKLLEANAMLKNNVHPVMCGASSTQQVLESRYNPRNMGSASVEEMVINEKTKPKLARTDSQKLNLDRLDRVIPNAIKSKIDFMKIDVEGHELSALLGAVEIIKASMPVIVIELSGGQKAIADTLAALQKFGYDRFCAPIRDIERHKFSTQFLEKKSRVRGIRRAIQLREVVNFVESDYPFVLVFNEKLHNITLAM